MSVFYGNRLVTDNLLVYLDGYNTKSYPGSGNIWYDLSGKNNNATISNSPTFSDHNFTLNGSNQNMQITNNGTMFDGMRNEQTVMVALWKNTFTSRQNPLNISYAGIGTWTHETNSVMNGFFGNLGYDGGSSPTYYTSMQQTFNSGQWNFLTRTIKYPNHAWFNSLNKTSGSNPFVTLGDTNANILIGSGYAGYWSGKIGLLLIYDRELTDSEVAQNFNVFKNRYGL